MKVAEILKTEGIFKSTKDETLGTVLNNLSSSHDAAFIFEDKDFKKYLGVINPYYALIKSNYPPDTKVERAIFHAPKLKLEDSLSRAAKLMIESKVHYLPVLDPKTWRFLGIATARRIIKWLLKSKRLNVAIKKVLAFKRPLITIKENESIIEALKKFREEKVSKLVVVDDYGHLRGVLAYFDLIPLALFPKKRASLGERGAEKNSRLKTAKVKNFMKSYVLVLPLTASLKQAAELIWEKEIGSVIIVSENRKPIGIITTKDILKTGFEEKQEENALSEVELNIVNEKHRAEVKKFVERLLKKAQKAKAAVKILFDEEKRGGVIKARVDIYVKGEVYFIRKEDKNLRSLFEKLESSVKRILKSEK